MSYTRRSARWALVVVATWLITACGGAPAAAPTAAPAATEAPTAPSVIDAATATPEAVAEPTAAPVAATLNGITLPADAAPADQQVYRTFFNATTTFTTVDFLVSVYEEGGAVTNILSEPLIRLDNNFMPMPAAALSWSANADGTEWTFNLDPNLKWSDGTPVTAADYVTTFQYAADKEHAWDFFWFFQAPGEIKNWSKVGAGELKGDQLGVVAKDANTVVFTTETPAPF
jgi:oligopeptide transport system substrate-binding protein